MDPRSTLTAFDVFLAERGLALEAIVIGGAALALLGVIERPTKDCDVLAPTLSDALSQAARDFARAQSADELATVLPWLSEQDGHPQWPEHARRVLADLGTRLGHGV